MKEIKFRGIVNNHIVFRHVSLSTIILSEAIKNYDMDKLTFEQYTGLKDKNGVEIYECDIIKYEGGDEEGIGEVKACLNSTNLYCVWSKANFTDIHTNVDFLACSSEIEIIGNIHNS